jgi:hypothetical protein
MLQNNVGKPGIPMMPKTTPFSHLSLKTSVFNTRDFYSNSGRKVSLNPKIVK